MKNILNIYLTILYMLVIVLGVPVTVTAGVAIILTYYVGGIAAYVGCVSLAPLAMVFMMEAMRRAGL